MSAKRILFVFDFDLTLTEADTDNHVASITPETLNRMMTLQGEMQWTALVNSILSDLHSVHRKTSLEILQHLISVPIDSQLVDMVKFIANPNEENETQIESMLAIISDSNTEYIDKVLEYHGVRTLFTDVITNTATITSDDKLIVLKRHDDEKLGNHGCNNGCAVNLCKGKELDDLLAKNKDFDIVVYSGDGKNDWCPSTRLRETDYVCPRIGYRLNRLINEDKKEHGEHKIKANVLPWSSITDLYTHFRTITSKI